MHGNYCNFSDFKGLYYFFDGSNKMEPPYYGQTVDFGENIVFVIFREATSQLFLIFTNFH